jgi:hypothetical protein
MAKKKPGTGAWRADPREAQARPPSESSGKAVF